MRQYNGGSRSSQTLLLAVKTIQRGKEYIALVHIFAAESSFVLLVSVSLTV